MKKGLLLIVANIFFIAAFAQQPDSLRADNYLYLSPQEAAHLNELFEKEREGFDFTDKLVVFYNPVSGKSKVRYFESVKKCMLEERHIVAELVLLAPEEKKAYGYDTLVSYWNKKSVNFTPRYRKKVLSLCSIEQ